MNYIWIKLPTECWTTKSTLKNINQFGALPSCSIEKYRNFKSQGLTWERFIYRSVVTGTNGMEGKMETKHTDTENIVKELFVQRGVKNWFGLVETLGIHYKTVCC